MGRSFFSGPAPKIGHPPNFQKNVRPKKKQLVVTPLSLSLQLRTVHTTAPLRARVSTGRKLGVQEGGKGGARRRKVFFGVRQWKKKSS